MASTTFTLHRDTFGKLVMTDADGQVFEGVAPVRAFPIQSPDEGISLVLGNGKEVAWIDHVDTLPEPARSLLQEELEGREFMPEIARVKSVSSFATPCTWYVDTDRGETQFVLKGEEDIRRIGAASLLIADNHGIHFLIRDMFNIDKTTRKILDRFL
ncbi:MULTISPECIES: cyanophycin metabolism-associated DUF1854 family protein [Janthinobacterium]|uniref:DUF1854 domain-containing protein n=1 Tax=Janthinobacterium kumbetense TaxID=2950280 RepID=A0ABT0WV33_9BURK|nr:MULTISPECIES: DUF1854 domain-containing protein [Janthinobacterium]MCM2567138.1 DUF1854 domain-containing protein [Janthinobacterium kumbetense]MDN2670715.1 DUF1854 domain-containing protein [Janthinobacterium sp. SUN026]MDN2677268.1 DUF1854 domain-containing protein [Janthinobacterium sp. SUN033]MDN2702259.1 DUF1854 domain-containing protein [Janthinobacterium sp. SUN100]MDO8037939.1 DUF1854 domain-containing protein [Janthinobacterium sp. SUN137]